MSTVVAFVSQKGGVGKSTLARGLGREAKASGIEVKIADLDTQQGTSVDWYRMRLDANIKPIVPVELFRTAQQALAITEHYDLLIIDGPARTSKATLEIARVASLIVQPTGASVDDLRPAIREFHGLVKEGIPKHQLIFALNHIGTEAEAMEAREYIEEAGYTALPGYLPERPGYRRAQNAGYAITETRFSGLNEKADMLVQSLIDKVADG